jgi:hypothetical protein
MNNRSHFLGKPIAIASAFLVSIVLVACEQSKQAAPAPAPAATSAATTEKVSVVFEGPWAIVADPKDANSVLALAPKTKLHRDLYVSASNESTLPAGTYDLSVPAHGAAFSGTLDPSFAQAKIDAKSLQHALGDKSGRYVIRLPKPEAYGAVKRFRSRVGPSYPPDASTEQNYVVYASLRYSVSSLSGFSLAGTPDSGTFNPLLLQVDTPTIRFVIEPGMADLPTDRCSTHSRESFHDLAKFLSLTLYVDFPDNPGDCHKSDPQSPRPGKAGAGLSSPMERMAAVLSGDSTDMQTASTVGAVLSNSLRFLTWRRDQSDASDVMAAVYFFHGGGGSCLAPILFLTTTP